MLLTQPAETATAAGRVDTAGGGLTPKRTSKARLKATRWPSPWASTSAPSHSMMMPSGPPTPLPSAAAARKSAARWRAAAAAVLPPPTALQLLRWAGAAHARRWPAAAGVMADAGRATERAGNTPTAACIVAVTRGSVAQPGSRSTLQETRSPPPWRGQPPSRLRQLDSPNAGRRQRCE